MNIKLLAVVLLAVLVASMLTAPAKSEEIVLPVQNESVDIATVTATVATNVAEESKRPGFEAVFAIVGLLAVAYLVLRQKK